MTDLVARGNRLDYHGRWSQDDRNRILAPVCPFDRWFERRRSRQEGVPGVDQKARGPEPKTGRGQSFQSAAHLFREPSYQTVTSTIRQQRPCSRGSSQECECNDVRVLTWCQASRAHVDRTFSIQVTFCGAQCICSDLRWMSWMSWQDLLICDFCFIYFGYYKSWYFLGGGSNWAIAAREALKVAPAIIVRTSRVAESPILELQTSEPITVANIPAPAW